MFPWVEAPVSIGECLGAVSYIPRYNNLAIRCAGGIMARNLVWLENFSFAAWGCAECSWITPSLGVTLSGKASRRYGQPLTSTTVRTSLVASHQPKGAPTRSSELGQS